MQHRLIAGLENLAIQRSDIISELISVCGSFMQRLEEEKSKIISIILPVAILLSASKKTNPTDDPMRILKRYRYENNPNAQHVIVLSELFDLYEYTEQLKTMMVEDDVSDKLMLQYQESLEAKILEKENLIKSVSFATLEEIDQAFAGILYYEEDDK